MACSDTKSSLASYGGWSNSVELTYLWRHMSTHLAMPRWGHLEQVHHIFGYLKDRPKWKLFFDLQHPELDKRSFTTYDWYDFYRNAKEPVLWDMPAPRGQVVSTHCFVGLDHAANTVM